MQSRKLVYVSGLLSMLWSASAVVAQGTAVQGIIAHDLGPVLARSAITLAGDIQVVALGGGRVLVADVSSFFLQMLDSSLSKATVVMDSSAERAVLRGYVIPHRGDSALVLDTRTTPTSFRVITPDGRLGRTIAEPAHQKNPPSVQPRGRASSSKTLGLFYREQTGPMFPRRSNGVRIFPGPAQPDNWGEITYVLVRMSHETRAVDTIARFAGSNEWMVLRTEQPNLPGLYISYAREFVFYDEAVATTDGAVAVFHAREYRIQWMLPDGTRAPASQSLQYPWRRITDDMRQHILDSINGSRRRSYDSAVAQRAADSIRAGGAPMVNRLTTVITEVGRGKVPVTRPAAAPRLPFLLTPQSIPDFYPPTTGRSQILADADNNVWIRPAALRAPDGAWVWEVVNRQQGVIDRVRIPEDRTIAGFGPGGIVYLVVRDAGAGRIEKVRVR